MYQDMVKAYMSVRGRRGTSGTPEFLAFMTGKV